ncbi:MAG: hypothetical protein WCK65_02280 [Rhodospirillaceae bacterium]
MTAIGQVSPYWLGKAATSASSSLSGGRLPGSSLLGGGIPTYSFATDKQGHPIIATVVDLGLSNKPKNQIAIAGQVAESIRLQTDSAIKARSSTRVADMASQAEQVISTLFKAVEAVKTPSGGVKAGQADPALKPYQASLAKALGSLNDSLPKLTGLASKDAKTTGLLKDLSEQAGVMAKLAGVAWNPKPTGSAGTVPALRLADYLV